ncbi:MAG: VTC domain-containing protein, partial [Gammaproteobacteria bacterium]|nr:VTC domain-containing protein [Gammaproteobacteria bacterium]
YDDHFACYLEHHQDRRRRMKVRTREYVDSGDRYFEVKLKGLRGMTDKHRMACDFLISPEIQGEPLQMLRTLYEGEYRKSMDYALRPALVVGYQRCTLVALAGGERVTIDYGLTFALPDALHEPIRIDNDFLIVETKSPEGKGIADRAMKALRIRTASACSKYCLGVNLVGAVNKGNRFLATIRRIRNNVIGPPPEHELRK